MPSKERDMLRALKESSYLTATSNATAHESAAKSQVKTRLKEGDEATSAAAAQAYGAVEAAEAAGEQARQAGEGVQDALKRVDAGDLGFLDLGKLFAEGKLGDVGVYNSETRIFIPKLLVRNGQIGELEVTGAKIARLAVDTSHIRELSAARLTAGDVNIAGSINLVGQTKLTAGAGNTVLDSSGIQLTPLASGALQAAQDTNFKLTPTSPKLSALSFFEGSQIRGLSLRSDGGAGVAWTRIDLQATHNGDAARNEAARVLLNSQGGTRGVVNLELDATVKGNLSVGERLDVLGDTVLQKGLSANGQIGPSGVGSWRRQVYVAPITLASGQTVNISHGLTGVPDFIDLQTSVSGWRTCSEGDYGLAFPADTTTLRVTNNASVSRTFRVTIASGTG